MTETFSNIEKALEEHFSLHDVSVMMDLLHKYREYEHKLIRYYSEDDFTDFLNEYKKEIDNGKISGEIMITVFFETKTGSYVEEVASIKDEELYMLCLPILKKEAEKQNMIVTESVDEVLANKKQEVKEERVMLADENKNMAKFLETLGYKKNDIDCICVGDYEGVER